jgi:hypothetical protein
MSPRAGLDDKEKRKFLTPQGLGTPVASTLEHRASVKRFVSLYFNPRTAGRTPWTGDQTVARPLPTQDNTK